jgi:hypothetical protein
MEADLEFEAVPAILPRLAGPAGSRRGRGVVLQLYPPPRSGSGATDQLVLVGPGLKGRRHAWLELVSAVLLRLPRPS